EYDLHAEIQSLEKLKAGGKLQVSATNEAVIVAETGSGSMAVAAGTTTGSASFSGSGASAVNTIKLDVKSLIDQTDETGTIEVDSVELTASDESEIEALVGALSIAASFPSGAAGALSIGVSLSENTVSNDVAAVILGASNTDISSVNDVSVQASRSAEIISTSFAAALAVSFADSSSVAVSGAGAESTNNINGNTDAYIEDSNLVVTSGNLSVSTSNTSDIEAEVSATTIGAAVGGSAVGVSIGVSIARNNIGIEKEDGASYDFNTDDGTSDDVAQGDRVLISSGALAGDIYEYTSTTDADNDDSDGWLASQDFRNRDLWKRVGYSEKASSVRAFLENTTAVVEGQVNINSKLSPKVDSTVVATSVGVSLGKGLGIGINGVGANASNLLYFDAAAFTYQSEEIQAESISIVATDKSRIESKSGAGSLAGAIGTASGALSIGTSTAVNIIQTDVDAYAEDSKLVTTTGSIAIQALQSELESQNIELSAVGLTASDLNDASTVDDDDGGTDENEAQLDYTSDNAILRDLRTAFSNAGIQLPTADLLSTSATYDTTESAVDLTDGNTVRIQSDFNSDESDFVLATTDLINHNGTVYRYTGSDSITSEDELAVASGQIISIDSELRSDDGVTVITENSTVRAISGSYTGGQTDVVYRYAGNEFSDVYEGSLTQGDIVQSNGVTYLYGGSDTSLDLSTLTFIDKYAPDHDSDETDVTLSNKATVRVVEGHSSGGTVDYVYTFLGTVETHFADLNSVDFSDTTSWLDSTTEMSEWEVLDLSTQEFSASYWSEVGTFGDRYQANTALSYGDLRLVNYSSSGNWDEYDLASQSFDSDDTNWKEIGEEGEGFRYLGEDASGIDLSTLDFEGAADWTIVENLELSVIIEGERWLLVASDGSTYQIGTSDGLTGSVKQNEIIAVSSALSLGFASTVALSGAGADAKNVIGGGVESRVTDSELESAGAVILSSSTAADINATVWAAALAANASAGLSAAIGGSFSENLIGYDADFEELTKSEDAAAGAYAKIESSDIDATGSLDVTATGTQSIEAFVFSGAVAIAGGAGIGAGAGSGAEAINRINNGVQATLTDTAASDGISAATINFAASDSSTIKSDVAAATLSASVGPAIGAIALGVSLASNEIKTEVIASLDSPDPIETVSGAAFWSASSDSLIEATSTAATLAATFGSFAIGGAGAEAVNFITGSTQASVSNAELNIATDLSVDAENKSTIDATITGVSAAVAVPTTGSAAAGSIGVAIARNLIGNAYDSSVNADYDSGDTPSKLEYGNKVKLSEGPYAGAIFTYKGDGEENPDLTVQDYNNRDEWSYANLASSPLAVTAFMEEANATVGGNLSVNAFADQSVESSVLAISAALSLGASFASTTAAFSGAGGTAENAIVTSVQAYIHASEDSRSVSADQISVLAEDRSSIISDVGAGSIAGATAGYYSMTGAISIGVAVATNDIANVVAAYSEGTTLTARTGNLVVSAIESATAKSNVVAVSVAASSSINGLSLSGAGSSSTNTVNNQVAAYLESGVFNSAGDVSVESNSSVTITSLSGGVAGAFTTVGVAGAMGVALGRNLIGFESIDGSGRNNSVTAYINSSTVDAAGDIN
ncbi:MAG: hypothetical protein L7W43_00370, partial [Rubripirellula sp.]|nr:hypothetical protein [Rubripirellula sp.]